MKARFFLFLILFFLGSSFVSGQTLEAGEASLTIDNVNVENFGTLLSDLKEASIKKRDVNFSFNQEKAILWDSNDITGTFLYVKIPNTYNFSKCEANNVIQNVRISKTKTDVYCFQKTGTQLPNSQFGFDVVIEKTNKGLTNTPGFSLNAYQYFFGEKPVDISFWQLWFIRFFFLVFPFFLMLIWSIFDLINKFLGQIMMLIFGLCLIPITITIISIEVVHGGRFWMFLWWIYYMVFGILWVLNTNELLQIIKKKI